ncbi:MAG: ATP-binding protein, partial [Terriglobia bacterium]
LPWGEGGERSDPDEGKNACDSMGLESFLGNPEAVSVLREMLARGAVPGALLFSGPEGVGKKSLAVMAAKAMNCERLRDDFCQECARCRRADEMLAEARDDLTRRREMKDATRRVEGLVYFDLQVVEPLTHFILTEQIRQARNVAYTRPFEFRRRIFILDQAQAIHWQAVDLLLKIMEEPPPTTTFILVCPNPYELRVTLRSRCLKIGLRPVEKHIVQRVLRDERQVPAAQLELATRAVAGSIQAAKSFNLAEFERLRSPWVAFLDGVATKDARRMAPADWRALFEATKALSDDRDALEGSLKRGYTLLSDILQVLETHREEQVVNLDLFPRLRGWAAKLGLGGIEKMKQGLDDARRLQVRNVNQQLGWEALAAGLLAGH